MSNKINRFNYKDLRNGPHLQMQDDFIALTVHHPLDEMALSPLLTRYFPAVEAERKCFEVMRASVQMPDLEAMDKQRDDLFRGFTLMVQGNTHHYDEYKRSCARRVAIVLRSYGNLSGMTLDDESAKMEDLHSELSNPPHFVDVSELDLGQWLAKLADANKMYRDMSQYRMDELSGHTAGELRKARLEVDKQFRSILNYLDVMMDVNPNELFTKFTDGVNAITQHYEHIVAQEQGVRDANKDKEDPMM